MQRPIGALVPLALVAAVAAGQTASPRKPTAAKPAAAKAAAPKSEKDKLAEILNRQSEAYLACGDPEQVPPPKVDPKASLIDQANAHTAYLTATNKIYGCQKGTFEAAYPDLKKTGATDVAISAAMETWQSVMNGKLKDLRDKAAASPSPSVDKQ